jgi:predicted RNase H-like nuclease (RuvC/YqgF family)
MVQTGRDDEQRRKIESLQKLVDHRETTIKGLELTNDDLKKQLEAKKKIILKMKENPVALGASISVSSTAHSSLQHKKPLEELKLKANLDH